MSAQRDYDSVVGQNWRNELIAPILLSCGVLFLGIITYAQSIENEYSEALFTVDHIATHSDSHFESGELGDAIDEIDHSLMIIPMTKKLWLEINQMIGKRSDLNETDLTVANSNRNREYYSGTEVSNTNSVLKLQGNQATNDKD